MSAPPPRRAEGTDPDRPAPAPSFLGAPVTPLQVVLFVLAFLLFALAGRWVGQALSPDAVPPPAATATAVAVTFMP